MGPGARTTPPNQPNQPGRSITALLNESPNIRSTYIVRVQDAGLFLSYDLKGTTRSYNVLFDNLPLSGFKKWVVYGGPKRGYAAGITAVDVVVGMETLTGKHLTDTQVEGLVYHSSKRAIYSFYGVAAAASAACAISYRTSATMKFPFRSPKPLDGYNYFPARSLPLLTGPLAQSMWQVARYTTWGLVCLFAIRPFFSATGNYKMLDGIYEDPRTKDLKPLLKATLNNATSNRRQSSTSQQDSNQGQREEQDSYEYAADQEPINESFDRNTTFDTDQDLGHQSHNRAGEQYDTQWKVPETRTGPAYERPPVSRASAPSSGGDIFFDDDASPTAGNNPDMSHPSRYGKSQGGGVWDSIRRGGSSQPGTASSAQTSQSQDWNSRPSREDRYGESMSSSGEGVSFSKSDGDRSYAREQAQKEFDEMLERERKSSGSGEYDRAMRAVAAGQESAALEGTSAWERRRR